MPLEKEMISRPQQWQLIMEIGRNMLHVMAFSQMEHHAMIAADIPLDRSLEPVKAFQDAVYANPLLLCDFRSVSILIPSERFIVAPDFYTSASEAQSLFDKAFSGADITSPEELICEPLTGMSATFIFGISRDMAGYLRRTFNSPRICHPLAPQALYFKAKHPTRPRGKMLVNLHTDRCDITILGDTAPLVLNSFEIHDPMDALYYIMACREGTGLTPTDEIILAGQAEMRRRVSELLRRYVRYVIPAILPSVMLQAGNASLRLPFEIVITPLVCN